MPSGKGVARLALARPSTSTLETDSISDIELLL